MFRTPSVPILLNRRTNRTSADLEHEDYQRRAFRAFVTMLFADIVIIAATLALTHSWLPNVR